MKLPEHCLIGQAVYTITLLAASTGLSLADPPPKNPNASPAVVVKPNASNLPPRGANPAAPSLKQRGKSEFTRPKAPKIRSSSIPAGANPVVPPGQSQANPSALEPRGPADAATGADEPEPNQPQVSMRWLLKLGEEDAGETLAFSLPFGDASMINAKNGKIVLQLPETLGSRFHVHYTSDGSNWVDLGSQKAGTFQDHDKGRLAAMEGVYLITVEAPPAQAK